MNWTHQGATRIDKADHGCAGSISRAYTQHNTNPQAAAKQYKHATNSTDADNKNRIRNRSTRNEPS
jgi:hypothetical protein